MTQSSEVEARSTAASAPTTDEKSSGMNVNKLGIFLDGWADLVEGRSEKANEVKQLVYQYLVERNMPDVKVKQVTGSVALGSQKRPYNITTTYPSAKTAIYVGQHGQDLYVSWRTFIKPQPNGLLLILFVLSLIAGVYAGFQYYDFRSNFSFFADPVIEQSSVVIGLIVTIFFFSMLTFFVAILGIALKGDFRGYFFVEPNIFDAEDITAMSLSAHKSILRALDKTGIDVTQLRLKQSFKGGRVSESI